MRQMPCNRPRDDSMFTIPGEDLAKNQVSYKNIIAAKFCRVRRTRKPMVKIGKS